MEILNNNKEHIKNNFLYKIKYVIATIAIILGTNIANSQNTVDQRTENIKKGIEKYIPAQDQEFFYWTLEEMQAEEYIWQNIGVFMDATIGNLPKEEDQIIWKLIAINLMFADSAKNIDYIKSNSNIEMEIDNFYNIYRDWRKDYRKYLVNKEKINSERTNNRKPKFLKKDPSKVQKPIYNNLDESNKNNIDYLDFARQIVKKDYPEDEWTIDACITYIEEDKYIKTNVEKILAKTVGTLPENERWIATLQAISIITKWLTNNWSKITTTFTERNLIKISKKAEKKVNDFVSDFTDWWGKYLKFTKKPRRF